MTYQSEWENCQPFDELAPKTWAKYRGKLPDRHGSMSDLFEMIAFAAVNDFAGVDFWDWQLEFGAALSEELDAASEYVMLGWPGPNCWGETAREYARWARRKRVKSKFAPKSMSKLKTLPAVAWTVAGMIVKGQTFLLYGQRKAGKTFAAIDLGLCIATGRDYHGCKVT